MINFGNWMLTSALCGELHIFWVYIFIPHLTTVLTFGTADNYKIAERRYWLIVILVVVKRLK